MKDFAGKLLVVGDDVAFITDKGKWQRGRVVRFSKERVIIACLNPRSKIEHNKIQQSIKAETSGKYRKAALKRLGEYKLEVEIPKCSYNLVKI